MGKTEISRSLSSRIHAVHISVGELVKKERLVDRVDEERGTLVADMSKVSKRMFDILNDTEGDVVIEGHYVTDVVPAEEVSSAFVLRRDPAKLMSVMKSRGYSDKKIRENLEAEILDVCLYSAIKTLGQDRVCEIDVSHKSVEEVVDEIVSVLDGREKCHAGNVDWLGRLEEEGRLQEYLKDF